jgi:periplasmic divalent cation tolerance protein
LTKTRSHENSSIMILVTCPDVKTAKRIASSIIRKRLAACVNIITGVRSVYRWKGKVEETSEKLLLIKSRRRLLNKITQDVKQNHPYLVPEIVALPIMGGSREYLQWVAKETSLET